ncbi:FAD-dependent monooxygenase [Streptomyces sp. NPDC053427]|uniref:FAD-dependent monooxygenase n=1 Tax=Streptomyces sp. NPDC053427 TaxID=3365701 RepID=UPI0037D40EE5
MSEDVVIVGAGTAGLMLAHELALAGVRPVVLDRAERTAREAPALALNAGVVELLAQRGFMDVLRDRGNEFPAAQWAYLWLDPERLGDPHPFTFGIPQPMLDAHIREVLGKLGVEVRTGHEVVGLSQDADGAVVEVRTPDGRESVRCRYVVGCDGARGTVRELAGIEAPGEDHPFWGIYGEVEAELGGDLFEHLMPVLHPDGSSFVVSPSDPQALRVLMGEAPPPADGKLLMRVITGEFGVAPKDGDAPVTAEELRSRARVITGADTDMGETKWLARWGYSVRQAAEYRKGRVFLAGDAAHHHFPLGGVALSTGLDDAVNLGWKLAAELNGWAPDGLLDTYHEERHPVGERACRSTEAQVFLMHRLREAEPLRDLLGELMELEDVNEYFVKLGGGLDARYAMLPGVSAEDSPHRLMGTRLPDFPLDTATGPTNVARLLYSGRGVLLDLSDGALPAGAAAGWTDRVDVVTARPAEGIDAGVVLLRPDGRVAWADSRPSDVSGLRTALETWFGAPRDVK